MNMRKGNVDKINESSWKSNCWVRLKLISKPPANNKFKLLSIYTKDLDELVWVISISSNVVGNPIWNHQQGRDRAIYLRHINYCTPCISWSPCMGYCHIFYDHKTLRAHCTARANDLQFWVSYIDWQWWVKRVSLASVKCSVRGFKFTQLKGLLHSKIYSYFQLSSVEKTWPNFECTCIVKWTWCFLVKSKRTKKKENKKKGSEGAKIIVRRQKSSRCFPYHIWENEMTQGWIILQLLRGNYISLDKNILSK